MKPGVYKVEAIDKRTALLKGLEENGQQYTFPLTDFTHNVSVGDVVEIWQEGVEWKTKYIEEKTESVSSHTKDFVKRILDQE
ncbi:hypothetical protein A1A1_04362 [Planococcus antarcticus DSM 14505]|uniref:Uncharacterized protein n=1 Tax=Planococcus antarcticus DSM 14505 TaxID=1185653 RepID=A0A1C7DCZ5_9BACL|nr:hypothetical protein [Planococcus antarcticus]ANU09297.1 hypothetical protein BBH88_02605 [Planococcus antarcticus DSM 14505]EIM07662.1 hypothetical protein A1A1_04362 [Planococcus antarcticus DSM 14505]